MGNNVARRFLLAELRVGVRDISAPFPSERRTATRVSQLLSSARVSDFAVLSALGSIAYAVALAKIALHWETKQGHFLTQKDAIPIVV